MVINVLNDVERLLILLMFTASTAAFF